MSIVLPTTPARSVLEVGSYVDNSSTAATPKTLKVKSTLKPGARSSYVVRVDTRKESTENPGTFHDLAVYTVIMGDVEAFVGDEKASLLDEVRAVMTLDNIARIERGER